jgi:hypothetical protein
MSEKHKAILSFIGGLVFLSVLTTVLVNKNSALRAEIENQAQGFLNISREALRQAQRIIGQVSMITGGSKETEENDTEASASASLPADDYDALWELAEAQNRAHVKSRLS